MNPSTNVDMTYHTVRPLKADTQKTAQLSNHASLAPLIGMTNHRRKFKTFSDFRFFYALTLGFPLKQSPNYFTCVSYYAYLKAN